MKTGANNPQGDRNAFESLTKAQDRILHWSDSDLHITASVLKTKCGYLWPTTLPYVVIHKDLAKQQLHSQWASTRAKQVFRRPGTHLVAPVFLAVPWGQQVNEEYHLSWLKPKVPPCHIFQWWIPLERLALCFAQISRNPCYKICAWSDWLAPCLFSTNCHKKKLIFPTFSAVWVFITSRFRHQPTVWLSRWTAEIGGHSWCH